MRCAQCNSEVHDSSPVELCVACLRKLGFQIDSSRNEISRLTIGQTRPRAASLTLEEVVNYFSQLEILRIVGQGESATVFEGRYRKLDRQEAIAVFSREVSCDQRCCQLLFREARALANLNQPSNHPNIVSLHEVGKKGDYLYFVMEFVNGSNLSQLPADPNREWQPIVSQICDAIQFARSQGVSIQDLSPESVMIDESGQVKLIASAMRNCRSVDPAS